MVAQMVGLFILISLDHGKEEICPFSLLPWVFKLISRFDKFRLAWCLAFCHIYSLETLT